jgi:hypothetical protein
MTDEDLAWELLLAPCDEFIGRQGAAKEVALEFVTAIFHHEIQLCLSFHPFCDDIQTQAAAHRDDGGGYRGIVQIFGHTMDEGFVDLKSIDRQTLEVTER